MIERSLVKVRLLAIWTDGKAEGRAESSESEKRKSQKKEDQSARKVEKSPRNAVFSNVLWFVALEGRKARRRGTKHIWTQNGKSHQCGCTFGSWDVEKVHAAVARITFPSQNGKNTTVSEHFWKLRSWKSARRCGAKHISKWTWEKRRIFGPLLEAERPKKCTLLWPFWHKAHLELKMWKAHHVRTILDVQPTFFVATTTTTAAKQNYTTTTTPITTTSTTTPTLQLQLQLPIQLQLQLRYTITTTTTTTATWTTTTSTYSTLHYTRDR